MDDTHRVLRPQWICVVDGNPWPCREAKRALLREHGSDRTALPIYLSLLMADAMDDLGMTDLRKMYQRFVSWTLPENCFLLVAQC